MIRFFLRNRLITAIFILIIIGWGMSTAPFSWNSILPRDPVPVDAIPDLGENQQIIITEWAGRSPEDIEDQITYPLTSTLLGVPGVRTIRSNSMFGLSSIYLIFNEGEDYYDSRSRILEKLNALPANTLPEDASPSLGPDATGLGQVLWYTLEGRDSAGNVTGGWDLQELRTIQDYYVKYALSAVEDVAEVASVGGFVKEYQVDVRPEALEAYEISLQEIARAVSNSNREIGARTVEINRAEYFVRGLGYVENLEDLENAVVKVLDGTPIRIADVARVNIGPAQRRGALDKGGAEVVGGSVVARYGSNPLEVINNVKRKISDISGGLPSKKLNNGTVSKVTIVPFYDRSGLIYETLGTLEEALTLELFVTVLVILILVLNIRASIVISLLLPLAILMVFIAMRYTGVDANIVALSGIAIAIGTMVDLGIIMTENVIRQKEDQPDRSYLVTIAFAAKEVQGAIIAAVSTTIVSFIPVFLLEGAEGKLFRPLAFTKTYALVAALIVSLAILPSLIYWIMGIRVSSRLLRGLVYLTLLPISITIMVLWSIPLGIILIIAGILGYAYEYKLVTFWKTLKYANLVLIGSTCIWLLARKWLPVGVESSLLLNFIFVTLLLGFFMGFAWLIIQYYSRILYWCLENRFIFLMIPLFLLLLSSFIWLGFQKVAYPLKAAASFLNWDIEETTAWQKGTALFPGLGREFMPTLDEGSFLLMPTSMPHSGMEENLFILKQLDARVSMIPEVEEVVGKMGRAETALDPAPISMFENVIRYKPEFMLDKSGRRIRFASTDNGNYITTTGDTLNPDEVRALRLSAADLKKDNSGSYFRNWRENIKSPEDIWQEIVTSTNIPGVTSSPKLQPIETRLVMLQTGMRAPMGIKIFGPSLEAIEAFGMELEPIIKNSQGVKPETVFAERIIGKPYLEIEIHREVIARYGLTVNDVLESVEVAVGGMRVSTTVEGRERYPIRIRYPRELRDDASSIAKILVKTPTGAMIPLGTLTDVSFRKGPQMIKSEDTFLTSYVVFDKQNDQAEVNVVQNVSADIQRHIENGSIELPAGISYEFSGSYENQVRAEKKLSVVIPLVLIVIFLILYFHFKSVTTGLMVFSGIAVAFSGGFLLLWLYGLPGFMNFEVFGTSFRDLFQMGTINLSVAVWVGFIALFGIATDDGVLMATYLHQKFKTAKPMSVRDIRATVMEAGLKRVRPAMMTTLTTLIALLPVLGSTGKGSDIMVPMAIPIFGGMTIAIITMFIVPVLYGWHQEILFKLSKV
ncbi:efflux RND transporter permease subunit [Fulvivirga sedimenti]|uniref:Efflux RND transporter permease subunit n=1 Tax=Fulvivirga sedimenti TaxID=2879465 RepID=A0A9X1KXC2_9BACT|nr:efflux RND transporter permease subunit [Fulvivirga sedimenti]MCA6074072.1 efflux RND transporter permease subunit [Fulvivirga sedimenti]